MTLYTSRRHNSTVVFSYIQNNTDQQENSSCSKRDADDKSNDSNEYKRARMLFNQYIGITAVVAPAMASRCEQFRVTTGTIY